MVQQFVPDSSWLVKLESGGVVIRTLFLIGWEYVAPDRPSSDHPSYMEPWVLLDSTPTSLGTALETLDIEDYRIVPREGV